jgi:starch synthase
MPKKKKTIKVLMATAEAAPLAKVGGLADVAGSLPSVLKRLGVDIRLVMPLYGTIDRRKYKLKKIYTDLEIPSGRLFIKTNIYRTNLPGTRVPVYLIDAPAYFKYDHIYVPGNNSERFLFFSLAALYALPIMKFIPDIVHCQDYHTALIPDILKTTGLEYLQGLKTLFTIHNLNYQGQTETGVLSTGNLHPRMLESLSRDARNGDINFMVQGILNADLINTVSPTYAREITTSVYGAGLEKVLQKRKSDLYGILNGIDINLFNPVRDKYIKINYSARTLKRKVENKLALQKKLGLPVDKEKPLVGMVARLFWQKGVDLITKRFSRLNCQFVFLGTGLPEYEEHLQTLVRVNPKQFRAIIDFDVALAQEIYAGADIFLMPSRFEPCGLGQMIAMRYGAVPVVRATGGLADTVTEEVGFSFKNVSTREFYQILKEALDVYYDQPERWRALQVAGMKKNFSWRQSAREYLKLYQKLV